MFLPSNRIANWLVEKQAISESDGALYAYAAHSFLLSLFPLGVLLLYSIITHTVLRLLLVAAPLFLLRQYGGGFHANKYWKCFLLTVGVIIGAIQVCIKIPASPAYIIACSLLANSIIIILSPIEHSNHPLNFDERLRYHQYACWISNTIFILILFFLFLHQKAIAFPICLGQSLCALSQIVAKLIKHATRRLHMQAP